MEGLDSNTCGRFRFFPVATAAAAAIPTGPANQTTEGQSAPAAQELAGKDVVAVTPPAQPGMGAKGLPSRAKFLPELCSAALEV